MRDLYLMRHGTTIFNEANKIQGWCDSPLSAYGRRQAAWMGAWFAENGVTFDHAYCSTAGRTMQTLRLATGGSMEFEQLSGLREFFFGKLEGESSRVCTRDPFGDFLLQYGGESSDQVRERMVRTLTDVMRREGHESVLCVSHGSSGYEFFEAFRHLAKVDLGGKLPPRGSCVHYEFDGTDFRAVQVVAPNDDELEELDLSADSLWPDIRLDGVVLNYAVAPGK